MRIESRMTAPLLALLFLMPAACSTDGEPAESPETGAEPPAAPHVVDVVARDFAFDLADSLPSGWTTFHMTNTVQEEHFMYLYRLPEDRTFEQLQNEALAPFGAVWYAYVSGEIGRTEADLRLLTEVPAWFFEDVASVGGPALTEPGERARVTVRLDPGTYVAECYVKRADGTWHTELGMQRTLTVTDTFRETSPPEADLRMTLSSYAIDVAGDVPAGSSVIEVRAGDRPDGFMPHDVNLFRLDDASTTEGGSVVEEIVRWMDWMEPDGFRTPAPGHSMGGMEHLTPGEVGYIHLDLEPGSYAWVSEGYGDRGMVRAFTVP